MKKFIHEENLKLFRKRLTETTDPEKCRMLLKLLEEEEAKDDEPPSYWEGKSSDDRHRHS
jgi:hypothetical protein